MKTRYSFLTILLLALAFLFPVLLFGQSEKPHEFVTVYGTSLPEFDPHKAIFSSEAQFFTALYEGLFSYAPASLEPVNAAVATWSKSKDGLTYIFVIKNNAFWSDGSPLLASDFRDSWMRMLKLNADYAAFLDIIEGAEDFRTGKDTNPDHVNIEAVSMKTIVVRLKRPAAYFTRLLCHHAFAPIHQSMLGEGNFAEKIPFPVNGPYRFESISESEIALVKNEYYWDKDSVSIDRMKMIFSDDDAIASTMFNNENAHWLFGVGDYDAILMPEAIQVNPVFSTNYWFFNCSLKPWDNPKVRRALALLLPWNNIRSKEIYSVPATTLVLPLPGYSKAKGIESSNKAEAMKLLAEAGYPEGKGLPAIQIFYADSKENRRIVTLFKSAWETLPGLKVQGLSLHPAEYFPAIAEMKNSPDMTLAHTTWIGDFADPEAFLQMWTENSPLNDAGYSSEEFSQSLEKSYGAEGTERMNLLAEAETILLQQAAVLPIYHGFGVSVIDIDYIEGWYQNALDIHPYKYFKFGTPSIQPNIALLGRHIHSNNIW